MTDDDDNDAADEPTADEQRAQHEQLLALSQVLQAQILAILNGHGKPDQSWATMPHIAAHGCAEVLGNVLRACILRRPEDEAWALVVVEQVRAHVLAATLEAVPEPKPGARWH